MVSKSYKSRSSGSCQSLILVDVDGTLVDKTYKETMDLWNFQDVVTRTQSAGALLGLFSDTALPTLRGLRERYGFNGPILAERGAMLYTHTNIPLDDMARPSCRSGGALTGEFPLLRTRLITELMNRFGSRVLIIIGDVNTLSQHEALFPEGITTANTLVLINGGRRASLSFYVRSLVGGWCLKDHATYERVIDVCREVAAAHHADLWNERWEDANQAFGIYILHHRSSHKSGAVSWLRKTYPNHQIYMVGDSVSDDLRDSEIIQCAVGNASSDYKSVCARGGNMVATETYTAGVAELLRKITGIDKCDW